MCHDVRFQNLWIKYCPFPLDYITDLLGTSPKDTFRPHLIRKEVTILRVYSNPVHLRSSAPSRLVVAFSGMSISQFLFLSFAKIYQIKSVCVYNSCSSSLYIQPCTVAKFFSHYLSIAWQWVTIVAVKMDYSDLQEGDIQKLCVG